MHLETAVADGGDETLRPEPDRVAQRRADRPPDAAVLALELVPGVDNGLRKGEGQFSIGSVLEMPSCLRAGVGRCSQSAGNDTPGRASQRKA